MKRQDVLDRLSEQLPIIRSRFRVDELPIFGSVARDEANDASDLDVLVEFAGEPDFDAYMGLKVFLEELLHVSVDLVTPRTVRQEIRGNVSREAIRVPQLSTLP